MSVKKVMLLPRGTPIPLGERALSKEGKKFKIYLPMRLNSLWKELYSHGEKVEVYIVLKEM
jgi:hypothetical protein